MRYVRFVRDQKVSWGVLTADDKVQPLTAAPYEQGIARGAAVPVQTIRLMAPCQPSKIVAVGKSYQDHIRELDGQVPENPIIFIKPSTCVNDPEAPIVLPPPSLSQRVDYEGELALVIGRKAKNVGVAEALDYVCGYTCLNDITARDIQNKDVQWTRAKGFDGFAPIGPLLTDEVDPDHLMLRTRLNGKIVQESSTSQMIWPVRELIAFTSSVMTLLPGDVITTGTPSGIGPLAEGDLIEISIEGIGNLRNWVCAAPQVAPGI